MKENGSDLGGRSHEHMKDQRGEQQLAWVLGLEEEPPQQHWRVVKEYTRRAWLRRLENRTDEWSEVDMEMDEGMGYATVEQ